MKGAVNGDGPCCTCGGPVYIWWTDNVIWNQVIREDPRYGTEVLEGFMCAACFVKRAHERGLRPEGWRLIPEFPERWEGDVPSEPAS